MTSIHLMPLELATCDALAADPQAALPGLSLGEAAALLREIASGTAGMLRASGAVAPWIAYLACTEGQVVGTCAFKAPPAGGEVEIAYFTFPGQEGRGHGRAMAGALTELAFRGGIDRVVAHTLPQPGASAAILRRLGFVRDGIGRDDEAGETWRWVRPRQAA
jgi:RimJ/RimL family protein N-acetyltransferase